MKHTEREMEIQREAIKLFSIIEPKLKKLAKKFNTMSEINFFMNNLETRISIQLMLRAAMKEFKVK